ncbi:MAG: NAD-dependent epimerase/dehydratase family protein [Candidatus Eremiobacterota bacterium]
MHILLSGSTGLIGSHLIPLLAKDGHCVTCLVRSKDKKKQFTGILRKKK